MAPRKAQRGNIETLASGALRVRVYAGKDPLTKKDHFLKETVPAGPKAAKLAEQARTRLLNQVDERRNPKTNATLGTLLDKYLEVLDVEENTRIGYEGYIRNHIRPVLGDVKVAALSAETIERFYAQLRRCRIRCSGKGKQIDHRVQGKHTCDGKCVPHACKPMKANSVRQIHTVLSGAYKRAVKWGWLAISPVANAEQPSPPTPQPHPPTPEQAAQILNSAWKDLDWGTLLWIAMMTGSRRGEMCALRWSNLRLKDICSACAHDQTPGLASCARCSSTELATHGTVWVRKSHTRRKKKTQEKGTKADDLRPVTLGPETVMLLQLYRAHCDEQAATLGLKLAADAFMFSLEPDHSEPMIPATVGQRFARLTARLGFPMGIHSLRHFSATELIGAGVDIRTVAGRLGHGSGGAITLKYYSAWIAERDQFAAGSLETRMPALPFQFDTTGTATAMPTAPEPDSPYRKIATDLRGAITSGVLSAGDPLPVMTRLMERYSVSAGTAHRAIALLAEEGLVLTSRGKRTVVA